MWWVVKTMAGELMIMMFPSVVFHGIVPCVFYGFSKYIFLIPNTRTTIKLLLRRTLQLSQAPARAGPERFAVLTDLAAAIGLLDAALSARYERAFRPEPLRWEDWAQGQVDKIRRTLDLFETRSLKGAGEIGIVDIAVGCCLGYLDFRFPEEDWRATRPKLAAFYADLAKRPAWPLTDPAR